jgi:hypothetical protein
MSKLLFFILLFNINFNYLHGVQTINLEEQEICIDTSKCEKVNSIYIPSRPDKCTDDLLFQYGEDFSAYLSPEGNIKATSNESQCEIGFKRIKYALKNIIIEVIKHNNSVFVKSIGEKEINSSESIFFSIKTFIHDKIHDLIQYILIVCIVLARYTLSFLKKCYFSQR